MSVQFALWCTIADLECIVLHSSVFLEANKERRFRLSTIEKKDSLGSDVLVYEACSVKVENRVGEPLRDSQFHFQGRLTICEQVPQTSWLLKLLRYFEHEFVPIDLVL